MEISISFAVAQTFCLESEGEQRHKGHISAMRCWQRVPPHHHLVAMFSNDCALRIIFRSLAFRTLVNAFFLRKNMPFQWW